MNQNLKLTPHLMMSSKLWATGWSKFDDSRDVFPLTFLYSGMLWTGSTVRKRWRLVSGNLLYQISQVTTRDLSAGPPTEVATGITRVNQSARRGDARLSNTQRSRKNWEADGHIPNTDTAVSRTTVNSITRPSSSSITNPMKITSSGSTNSTTNSTQSISLSVPEKGISDWTAKNPSSNLTPYLRFCPRH